MIDTVFTPTVYKNFSKFLLQSLRVTHYDSDNINQKLEHNRKLINQISEFKSNANAEKF